MTPLTGGKKETFRRKIAFFSEYLILGRLSIAVTRCNLNFNRRSAVEKTSIALLYYYYYYYYYYYCSHERLRVFSYSLFFMFCVA